MNQEQMDNLMFVDDDPLHQLSNMLGEVLDDLEFDSDLVDEAKKLFILADVRKASGEIELTRKMSRMVSRQMDSFVDAVKEGHYSEKQFVQDKQKYKGALQASASLLNIGKMMTNYLKKEDDRM